MPSPPQNNHILTIPRPPLRPLVLLVQLAIRALDRMVGRLCLSADGLAWLDGGAVGDGCALDDVECV